MTDAVAAAHAAFIGGLSLGVFLGGVLVWALALLIRWARDR